MKRVRLVQLDGKIPNLALMKLAHWHSDRGDSVTLTRSVQPSLFDERPDLVYGSAIFTKSLRRVREFQEAYPDGILGGTGAGKFSLRTVEDVLGVERYERYDYSGYPEYRWSLGFTQRGCRLRCGFCVVPKKEGRPVPVNTAWDIWRPGTPRCLLLLDNDFFGQPRDEWRKRIEEIRDGKFKVSFSQGVNIRLVDQEAAEALASVQYRDDQFERRRLYTAWDNMGDERVFFRGLERLEKAGVPPAHLMVYMLVGYAKEERIEDVLTRYRKLVDAGCKPYPMVYGNPDPEDVNRKPDGAEPGEEGEESEDYRRQLRDFQRWVIGRYAEFVDWKKYGRKTDEKSKGTIPLIQDEAQWTGTQPARERRTRETKEETPPALKREVNPLG